MDGEMPGKRPTGAARKSGNPPLNGRSTGETSDLGPQPYEPNSEEKRAKEAHRQAEVARAQAEGHQVIECSWGNPDEPDDGRTIEHDPGQRPDD
jgi:hypothetical protein